MKWIFTLFIIFFFFQQVQSQTLRLKGRIRCSNDENNSSTRGAKNILVIPSAIPSKSVSTSSDPLGFYLVDTNVEKEVLYDQSIKLYIITNCKTCQIESITKFISSDQIVYNEGIPQINLKTKYIEFLCDSVEFSSIAIDTTLHDIIKQEDHDIKNDGWLASPKLLSLLGLISIGGFEVQSYDSIVRDVFSIDEIRTSKIKYGKFLLNSSFVNASTAGFNFSPSRDFSEAPFWNPASIPSYYKKANISISTNLLNQIKLSSFFKFNKINTVSIGFINSSQSEIKTIYSSQMGNEEAFIRFGLNEQAFFASTSFQFFKSLGFGITGKYMKQRFDNYQSFIRYLGYNPAGTLKQISYFGIPKEHRHSDFDFDLSFYYSLSKSLNLGLSFMNLTNSKLFGSNFLSGENLNQINQFSVGMGISYQYHRINFGTDILIYNNKIYNTSFGLNFIPFNKSLIQMSFSSKESVYSLSFKYNRFKISYIDSQGLLRREKSPTVKFAIPHLYSSFTLEF